MRCSVFIFFAALAQSALGQRGFGDPRETTDCIAWFEVQDETEQTCEWTLRKYALDPERFSAWNPSVGLDCKPWYRGRYCIMTNNYLADSVNTTTLYRSDPLEGTFTVAFPALTTNKDGWEIPVTRSDAPARTYSTRAPIPSPSTWTDKGCFIDDKSSLKIRQNESAWILDFLTFPGLGGRPDETLDTCKQQCWEIKFPIAGVKEGNLCFCGDRNNGTLAEDQGECNTPCAGDASVMCGGTNRTSVWEAEDYVQSTAAGVFRVPSVAQRREKKGKRVKKKEVRREGRGRGESESSRKKGEESRKIERESEKRR
ncbi:hypothetical protein C7974DRAFT_475267 [Boeremia exigua]|uniref:uncharacterized protein n=1 Tax=Boeremia exigua TaxID=749465 RepID=UPI001E8CA6A7|nr:uncharacterized protein C7974DRAFT_475267 [Boeremia exigua]KAH6614805.1 hypothetical protein C7974DRAFT_475267 [Boeremia exigua]